MLGVEELGVELVRRLVALADDEDLGRLHARRVRLGRVDALEELLQHPHQRLVVLGAEDLGHEPAAL